MPSNENEKKQIIIDPDYKKTFQFTLDVTPKETYVLQVAKEKKITFEM